MARGYEEFAQHLPRRAGSSTPPRRIWQATLAAAGSALEEAEQRYGESALPSCVGCHQQRGDRRAWDRDTLEAPARAIVWQDRRTAPICTELAQAATAPGGRADRAAGWTPNFTATKLTWLARHDQPAGRRRGRVGGGGHGGQLPGGRGSPAGGPTSPDASNASRTLLFDITSGEWSDDLCMLFGVPRAALPRVVPSYGEIGRTDPSAFSSGPADRRDRR